MPSPFRLWSAVTLLVSLSLSVQAQTPQAAEPREVADALTQAAAHPPEPAGTVAAAYDRLQNSTRKLDEFLAKGPREIQRGWNDYLDLATLKAELSQPEPELRVLRRIAERYYQDYQGLELPEFLAVRSALRGYFTAREYAAADQPQELFRQRIEELRECLTRLDVSFREIDAHRAGKLVAWAEPLGPQGARVAETVRPQYCRINSVAFVSGRAVNLLLERKVEEQNFITDMILGTYTQGTAYVNAQVSVGVVSSLQRSGLEVRVNGSINAPSTVAQRRNVTVHSSSQTSLSANKQVFLDGEGLRYLPATAAAASSTQLNDIDASRRFVERIAWRRATRMLPEAEQFVSRRAEAESIAKLDDQATGMLKGLHDTICQTIRGPLLRLNAFPVTHFSSNSDHLQVQVSQWNPSQLAPASPVPQFSTDYDLACGAHESMINNLAENLLGGQTIRDESWRQVVDIMTGDSPRPLWVHDRGERWSTTFAKERPLLAHFNNGRVGFTLRLAKISRGQREIEHPLEITAQFSPQMSGPDGPFLIREGELEIRLPLGLASDEEAGLRKFLAHKMGAIFPRDLHFDGLVAPAGGTIGRLRSLRVAEFHSQEGWLTLGYKIDQGSTKVAGGGQ